MNVSYLPIKPLVLLPGGVFDPVDPPPDGGVLGFLLELLLIAF